MASKPTKLTVHRSSYMVHWPLAPVYIRVLSLPLCLLHPRVSHVFTECRYFCCLFSLFVDCDAIVFKIEWRWCRAIAAAWWLKLRPHWLSWVELPFSVSPLRLWRLPPTATSLPQSGPTKAVKIADYNRGFPSHNCLLLQLHSPRCAFRAVFISRLPFAALTAIFSCPPAPANIFPACS